MVKMFTRSLESRGDELFELLLKILEGQTKMGDFTALNSQLASLGSAVASNTAAIATISALIGTLKAVPDQAAVDAAATQVSAAVTQVATNNATLAGLVPASTPAPVVVTPPVVAASS